MTYVATDSCFPPQPTFPMPPGFAYHITKTEPLDKLPAFNNDWNQELRLAWFQAFIACVSGKTE